MRIRDNAEIHLTPATDCTEKQGYGVTISGDTATLGASATVVAAGIITEGGTTSEGVSVAILGAFKGTVHAKLSGTVTKGARLQQHTDGSWVTDAASGARVVSLIALESGVSGDLIEAATITPVTLS
jgi:hypothetical protein